MPRWERMGGETGYGGKKAMEAAKTLLRKNRFVKGLMTSIKRGEPLVTHNKTCIPGEDDNHARGKFDTISDRRVV